MKKISTIIVCVGLFVTGCSKEKAIMSEKSSIQGSTLNADVGSDANKVLFLGACQKETRSIKIEVQYKYKHDCYYVNYDFNVDENGRVVFDDDALEVSNEAKEFYQDMRSLFPENATKLDMSKLKYPSSIASIRVIQLACSYDGFIDFLDEQFVKHKKYPEYQKLALQIEKYVVIEGVRSKAFIEKYENMRLLEGEIYEDITNSKWLNIKNMNGKKIVLHDQIVYQAAN